MSDKEQSTQFPFGFVSGQIKFDGIDYNFGFEYGETVTDNLIRLSFKTLAEKIISWHNANKGSKIT